MKTGGQRSTGVRLFAVAAVCVALALAVLAGSRFLAPAKITQPQVIGAATGTVQAINAAGTGICVAPADAQGQACGDLWRTPGQPIPELGSQITYWILLVPAAGGTTVEEFVIQPASGVGGV